MNMHKYKIIQMSKTAITNVCILINHRIRCAWWMWAHKQKLLAQDVTKTEKLS